MGQLVLSEQGTRSFQVLMPAVVESVLIIKTLKVRESGLGGSS